MTTIKCLAYTRQSVGKDGETEATSLSLNAQLDRIRGHCAREGWEIVGTIQDHDLSGEKWDRPGIQELMNRVRQGGIDYVVVFSVSRIARKVLHQEMVMDVLTEHGTQLVSVTEAGLDNILVRVMHAGMAEQHNVNHRKILKATIQTKANRGQHHGRPPYGYRVAEGRDHRLEIVPDEAAVVQRMYQMRADGMSARVIANTMNEEGSIKADGQRWHPGTVTKLLRRPTYAGYAVYRDQVVGDFAPGVAEPIVDRALWQQVQRQYANGRRAPRNPEHRQSWLEGLVRHGCGAGMSPGGTKRAERPFRCNNTRAINSLMQCQVRPATIAMRALEVAALHCLITDMTNRPTDAAEVARIRVDRLGQSDAVKRRARLMKQKTALVDQVARAEHLVTTGRRDLAWFDAFDDDAQAKMAVIDRELAELMDVPSEKDYEARIAEIARIVPSALLLELASPDALRGLLAALGHVLYDGTVRIEYAPEYRDLFPDPARVQAVGRRVQGVWEWSVSRCG